MYKIFIVEDDSGIAEAVGEQARMWGYETVCVRDFRNVTGEFAACDPQLVLMDITLPFCDGYHWCAEIRKVSKVPMIFISSASEQMNILMAINMGADDFVAKPFDQSVLMAKIRALLRRSYDFADSASLIEHRGAILNTDDGTLNFEGRQIQLTRNEFRILLKLMQNKGRIVSREALMEALWATDSFVDENTLTVNVARLRRKLEGEGLNGFITTKVGEGYLIE